MDFFSLNLNPKRYVAFLTLLSVFLSCHYSFSQNFENITIAGVSSGNGTDNALFTATSPTIPTVKILTPIARHY